MVTETERVSLHMSIGQTRIRGQAVLYCVTGGENNDDEDEFEDLESTSTEAMATGADIMMAFEGKICTETRERQ